MTLSTHVRTCDNCTQYYCCECSNATNWERFCSEECAEEFAEGENES